MLHVVELFSGVGAQASALDRLGIEYESVCCEIDPKAHASYCAIHGDTPNLGDVTKVEHLPECDLVTWSFPCQALSVAGKRTGMVEGSGTTSSLAWEVMRLLTDAKERNALPEWLVMENVPAVLNKSNVAEFRRLCGKLEELGYTNTYAVLNAKDFGVPQNRKRCFMVSHLGEGEFYFPASRRSDVRLKDILEDDVPEEYFLSADRIAKYEAHRERHAKQGNGFGWSPNSTEDVSNTVTTHPSKDSTNTVIITGSLNRGYDIADRVYSPDGIAPTVTTPAGGGHMPRIKVDSERLPVLEDGDVAPMLTPGRLNKRQNGRRFREAGEDAFTVTTIDNHGIAYRDNGELRIRYLTPRECWRLMGFTDSEIDRAFGVTPSRTQRYKQAGNSIAVPCLTAIFSSMFKE